MKTRSGRKLLHQATEKKNKKALLWAIVQKVDFLIDYSQGCWCYILSIWLRQSSGKVIKSLTLIEFPLWQNVKINTNTMKKSKKLQLDKMFHIIFLNSLQKKISFLPCMKVKKISFQAFFQQALCLNTEPPGCLRTIFLQLHPTLVQLSGFPKGPLQTEEKPLPWCWQALWHFCGPLLPSAFSCWPHRCK